MVILCSASQRSHGHRFIAESSLYKDVDFWCKFQVSGIWPKVDSQNSLMTWLRVEIPGL